MYGVKPNAGIPSSRRNLESVPPGNVETSYFKFLTMLLRRDSLQLIPGLEYRLHGSPPRIVPVCTSIIYQGRMLDKLPQGPLCTSPFIEKLVDALFAIIFPHPNVHSYRPLTSQPSKD